MALSREETFYCRVLAQSKEDLELSLAQGCISILVFLKVLLLDIDVKISDTSYNSNTLKYSL